MYIKYVRYVIRDNNLEYSIPNMVGYVPNHRCGIKECENISTASYYKGEILPFENSPKNGLQFSDFVQSVIGQINPSFIDLSETNKYKKLVALGKTCQRITPQDLHVSFPGPDPQGLNETCEHVQRKINETFENR